VLFFQPSTSHGVASAVTGKGGNRGEIYKNKNKKCVTCPKSHLSARCALRGHVLVGIFTFLRNAVLQLRRLLHRTAMKVLHSWSSDFPGERKLGTCRLSSGEGGDQTTALKARVR
jgi:hypothetical protein